MELSSSSFPPPRPSRLVFEMLMGSSIRRCIASRNACRVTVSLRCFHDSKPSPTVQLSISDTGMGSSLEELQNVADYCLKTINRWDGILSATTTCIGDKDIFDYSFNVKEAASSMLMRLPSKPKNGSTFSGSQISLTSEIEDSIEEYLGWVEDYVRKILVLNIPMIAFELAIDHIKDAGSKLDRVQFTGGVFLPVCLSSMVHLTSGLQEYLLKHGNVLDMECPSCFANKNNMKYGNAYATSENRKSNGQAVEAVIVIVNFADISDNSCFWLTSGSTKVLFFHDFVPCSMSPSAFDAVKSISWQDYGLNLRAAVVDGNGQAMLEWERIPSNTRIDIALHCYAKQYPSSDKHFLGQQRAPDKTLLKKAVKLAMDNLKSKHVGVLLSNHASKICSYAPDLSRSIASLIKSSNDIGFRGECASLLGLKSLDNDSEGTLELCIREKIVEIIELNDRNPKKNKDTSALFDFEHVDEEEEAYTEDSGQRDEDYALDLAF